MGREGTRGDREGKARDWREAEGKRGGEKREEGERFQHGLAPHSLPRYISLFLLLDDKHLRAEQGLIYLWVQGLPQSSVLGIAMQDEWMTDGLVITARS